MEKGKLCKDCAFVEHCNEGNPTSLVGQCPTFSEREIKRCRDCEYFSNGDCIYGGDRWCIPADNPKCADFKEKSNENDAVNSPAHYTSGGIECIDCIKAALGENHIGFLIGNVIKYVYRYKHKNGVEDLKKAAKYLEWAIQELEKEGG